MKKLFTAILISMPFAFSFAKVQVISISNFKFDPANVTIKQGDTIRFVLISGDHPVVSETSAWEKFLLSSGQSQDLTALEPGDYKYFCENHGFMQGKITVEDMVTGFEVSSLEKATSVYPNPSTGNFTIVNETGADKASLLSVNGEEVYSESLMAETNSLNLNLTSGNYLLILSKRGEIIERKKITITK